MQYQRPSGDGVGWWEGTVVGAEETGVCVGAQVTAVGRCEGGMLGGRLGAGDVGAMVVGGGLGASVSRQVGCQLGAAWGLRLGAGLEGACVGFGLQSSGNGVSEAQREPSTVLDDQQYLSVSCAQQRMSRSCCSGLQSSQQYFF